MSWSMNLLADDRRVALRDGLPGIVDLLKKRQADRIAAADLMDYLNLDWLEWYGGSLRLTVTGSNVVRQGLAPRR
jgi:hypothetical protein